tara:strand:- start:2892 stop:3707 length:816 start_codon:yes stop_codon:yes gene_type:complete
MNTIKMINPETSETLAIPAVNMTDYLVEGWMITDNVIEEKELDEETYFPEDVDAIEAIERDYQNAVFDEEPELDMAKHTKETVITALVDINKLNAAIAILGDLQTEDELASGVTSHQNGQGFSAAYARTGRRLWQWVTGKDAKTMEERWDKKCLTHVRANASFQRQTSNYDFNTAADLARHVCAFHWRQLASIVSPDFTGMELLKVDERKRNSFRPSKWLDITGGKVIEIKGGGTQILWDCRKIWLPTSQFKNANGKMSIPMWLAQKNDMV